MFADVATKALQFFKEFFGVAYTLPKMDLVAVPDFYIGAMENWGLLTFR
jgi:aminopeptidase N